MLVYKYGLLAPIENADKVWEQMRLAHELYNRLIEVDRWERAERRNLKSQRTIDLELERAQLVSNKDVAEDKIRSEHSKNRKRRHSPKADVELVDACRTLLIVDEELKSSRADDRRDPKFLEKEQEISLLVKQKFEALKIDGRFSAIFSGTRSDVEKDFKVASSSVRTGGYPWAQERDLKYKRWEGEGSICVQTQGETLDEDGKKVGGKTPVNSSNVFSCKDNRFQIEPMMDSATPMLPIEVRGGRVRTVARVKMAKGRDPGFGVFPMIMHRPLPNCNVKWVRVTVRRIGSRQVWELHLSIEPLDKKEQPDPSTVAIDVGWRQLPDGGIRVATWEGTDGAKGSFVMPPKLVSQIKQASVVKSRRDDEFNAIKIELQGWFKGRALPQEWSEGERPWATSIAAMHLWKSQSKMTSLWRFWKEHRIDGDDVVFGSIPQFENKKPIPGTGTGICGWRYHDHHLWNWECSIRVKSLAHRLEEYRKFAKKLSDKYGWCVVEDFDLRDVIETPSVLDESHNDKACSNRFIAAISILKSCLKNKFHGLEKVPAAYSSKACHECGAITKLKTELVYTCEHCGATWDRDENAAANLLVRYCEQVRADENAGVARMKDFSKKPSKRQIKMAEGKAKKKAMLEAARNCEETGM